MSFSHMMLQLIAQAARELGPMDRPIKMLSLGYPDLLVTPEHIKLVFNQEIADKLVFREDSDEIIKWHRLGGTELKRVIDTEHLLGMLNIELHVVDIVAHRKCERIMDLNEPLPPDMAGQYDIVIDGGTVEHCFNVGQAMKSVAEMTRAKGFVIQSNGLNNYNHGFWGINPTAYHDFYTQNHFRLMYFSGYSRRGGPMNPETFPLQQIAIFTEIPPLTGVCIVAQRQLETPIVWPMQSKYLSMFNAKPKAAAK